MSRIIGIDYGTKKVGVAISSEDGKLAFPVDVFENHNILEKIEGLAKEKQVETIVLGESTQLDMSDNPLMKDIRDLKEKLESKGYRVELENEFWSSKQASHLQGYNKKQDASAAAIILQSYLDKND